MTVRYFERVPGRAMGVVDTVGDLSPWVGAFTLGGEDSNSTAFNGYRSADLFTKGGASRWNGESPRIRIQRVTQGNTLDVQGFDQVVIGGDWYDGFVDPGCRLIGPRKRIELVDAGDMDNASVFQVLFKRREDETDNEAQVMRTYTIADHANVSISDYAQATGPGYYALRYVEAGDTAGSTFKMEIEMMPGVVMSDASSQRNPI